MSRTVHLLVEINNHFGEKIQQKNLQGKIWIDKK